MNYTKTILFIISFTISLIFFSCENATTPPTPTKSVRDYTWTIDTLQIPNTFQNLMRSMYAANDSDIYLVGHNSGSQIYSGDGGMWHYDGKDWSVVRLKEEVGAHGTPKSVHGSSSNNVWVVGGSFEHSSILQFNGVTWKKHLGKSPNGIFDEPLSKSDIYSVFVESETEVWACGIGGLVYHYDGINWDIDTLISPFGNNDRFQLRKIVGDKNNKYILANYSESWDSPIHFFILKYVSGKWDVIDSFVEAPYSHPFGVTDLYSSSFGELYSVGPEVYKRESSWAGITLDNYTWIWRMFDYGENNIIAVGTYRAFHYNGSDWTEIEAITNENISYRGVWMDDKNAFIIGNTTIDNSDKTIIWHGK